MANGWMVRAGQKGFLFEEFEKNNCVAIGWSDIGNLVEFKSKEEIRQAIDRTYTEHRPGHRQNSASQVSRFLLELEVGDSVISYNSDSREYLVGKITGEYNYNSTLIEGYPNVRQVEWLGRVSRDDLSVASKNSLGSTLTLFSPAESVWDELDAILKGAPICVFGLCFTSALIRGFSNPRPSGEAIISFPRSAPGAETVV